MPFGPIFLSKRSKKPWIYSMHCILDQIKLWIRRRKDMETLDKFFEVLQIFARIVIEQTCMQKQIYSPAQYGTHTRGNNVVPRCVSNYSGGKPPSVFSVIFDHKVRAIVSSDVELSTLVEKIFDFGLIKPSDLAKALHISITEVIGRLQRLEQVLETEGLLGL